MDHSHPTRGSSQVLHGRVCEGGHATGLANTTSTNVSPPVSLHGWLLAVFSHQAMSVLEYPGTAPVRGNHLEEPGGAGNSAENLVEI